MPSAECMHPITLFPIFTHHSPSSRQASLHPQTREEPNGWSMDAYMVASVAFPWAIHVEPAVYLVHDTTVDCKTIFCCDCTQKIFRVYAEQEPRGYALPPPFSTRTQSVPHTHPPRRLQVCAGGRGPQPSDATLRNRSRSTRHQPTQGVCIAAWPARQPACTVSRPLPCPQLAHHTIHSSPAAGWTEQGHAQQKRWRVPHILQVCRTCPDYATLIGARVCMGVHIFVFEGVSRHWGRGSFRVPVS